MFLIRSLAQGVVLPVSDEALIKRIKCRHILLRYLEPVDIGVLDLALAFYTLWKRHESVLQ